MEIRKSDVVAGAAALLVAGPIGMVASPFVYRHLKANTKRPRLYWLLLGLVTLPLCWAPLLVLLPEPPPAAPPHAPKQSEPSSVQMTPGQKFLKAKLAELDAIRQTSEFQEFKWSQAGPNPGWPQKLREEAEARNDLSIYEEGGVGMLALLGAEYASSDGAENGNTAQARRDVEEVINTPAQ